MEWRRLEGDYFYEYWVSDTGLIKYGDRIVPQHNLGGYKGVCLKSLMENIFLVEYIGWLVLFFFQILIICLV